MRYHLVSAAAVLLLTACGDLYFQTRSITSPSSANGLSAWCPCVGVHSPGGVALPIQMEAVRKLVAAGKMEWIRLGVFPTAVVGYDTQYHAMARAMGLKIVNVVQLNDLERYGWRETFDMVHVRFPHGPDDIWGIAGEVTNSDPFVNPGGTLSPTEYLDKFKDLYAYARERYPDAILSNGPTLGSSGGPRELQWFFDNGLLDMNIVVALNVYTDNALSQYGALFQNERYRARIAGKRIWITETGHNGRAGHIDHVERFYPRIRAMLNPEMICWYILWGGDTAPYNRDNGFGMLSGVENGTYEEGPLFRALAYPQEVRP